jgi:outer membrane protein assembly factor BamE (lipoprotein component of BamABCDE complex)
MKTKFVCALIIASVSAGCSIQRAQVAAQAQTTMIGMSKEQVLACMGPPITKATEGATEVWSYQSGNGHTDVAASGGRFWGTGTSTQRFCTVNVTMTGGRVAQLNYVGPTGGLLTAGEQCAFALENCTPRLSAYSSN